MIGYLVISLVMMLVVGASPYAWGKFIEYISTQNFNEAKFVLVVVLVLTACEIGTRFVLESVRYKHSHSVNRMLHFKVSNDILETPYSKFEKMNTGSILSKINSDLHVISNFISQDILQIILSVINILFYVAIITTQSIFFLMIVLINCVVGFFLNKHYGECNRQLYKCEKETSDKYQHQFIESLNNFIEIKSFGLEGIFKKKLGGALVQCESAQNGYAKVKNRQETTIMMLNVLGECIYMVLGFLYIKNGWMSLAMFIALFNYSAMLKQNIFSFSRIVSNMRTMSVSFDRIEDLLVEEDTENTCSNMDRQIRCIQLKQVDFGYDKNKKIIDSFTFEFEKGKIYILAGKNGSGKSTLLKLLRGLYEINGGQILINETPIQQITQEDKKMLMTFLCQEGSLFNDTLIRNITRFESEPELDQVNEIVEALNLKEHLAVEHIESLVINEKGANISGGQKQLINIARFMYQRAPIILLDELTSALDIHKTGLVSSLLASIKEEHIIIIASHDPEIFKIADQVCYFNDNGSISICDSSDLALKSGLLEEVGLADIS